MKTLALVSLLVVLSSGAHGQTISPTRIISSSKDLIKILRSLTSTVDRFDSMNTSLNRLLVSADAKRKFDPKNLPDSWGKLRIALLDVQKELQDSNLITRFDESLYRVSGEEFLQCRTQSKAIDRLQGYADELAQASDRGKSYMVLINDLTREMNRLNITLAKLDDLFLKLNLSQSLITMSTYNSFAEEWEVLNDVVKPTLNDTLDQLKRTHANVRADVTQVDNNLRRFRQNLSNMRAASCIINTQLLVRCSNGEETRSMTAKFSGDYVEIGATVVFKGLKVYRQGNFSATNTEYGWKISGNFSSNFGEISIRIDREGTTPITCRT